ncbi:threonine/serine exporter family protein [Aspergillus puulaauensis]|uniref:Threonine/serine exporter-like N-terminal domain-containing protein n=1 Tax=Aspergillus puulaauensis TaxID=1220207 RepID=A0A7R7XLL1_9EURO|nr:uncharacterized protein APUU_31734S [Aspergillus puulaauensis]BCS23509.1 hypothetical protein APUU_31734S [Aspergillus puulaauensis]
MPNPGVDTAVSVEHCQGRNSATSPRPDSPTATTPSGDACSAEKSQSPERHQNVCQCKQQQSTGATNGHAPTQTTDLENCTPVDSARADNCRKYVLKVCRALILFGAPTHRLEKYVHHTGEALNLHIQSFYMPGCMIMSFDNQVQESIDRQIIRSNQALNLAKLYDVHTVYKNVIHKKTTVEDAVTQIDEITDKPEYFPLWLRVLVYGLASMCIGPVSYNAQPVDLPIIFILGSLVGLSELILAPRSELYGYVFETCAAILASFIGRAFGSIHWGDDQGFCFSAISQASIVLILPGFTITSSALELQSKNMVSGAVRMVYAIVYTLFLSFGFTIGITIYGAIHHNATSETQCRTNYPVWWPIAFVLPFTFCYVIVNKGNWKQMPPMLGISLAGWCVNHFSNQRFAAVPTLSQALGALTVGVLANLYARIEHGMAVALMHPAIYLQVPGSLAASGSLISGLSNADQLNKNGSTDAPREAMFSDLNAGYTMAQIGIAITVGLSISVLLVYPIRKKARSGIFSL